MIRHIQLINEVFNKTIIADAKTSGLNRLWYSKNKKCFFTKSNQRKVFALLRFTFIERMFFNLEKSQLYSSSGYVFITSLNGCVVLDIDESKAYKILDLALEPNFLDNERRASKLTERTAKIIDVFEHDGFGVLVQSLVKHNKNITWEDWHNNLPHIIPMLIHKNNQVTRIYSSHYVQDTLSKLSKLSQGALYLGNLEQEITPAIIKLLRHYGEAASSSYLLFAHGDLTPNNVLIKDNQYILIDFANGGQLNFSYDLMLQNFYFTGKETWTKFDQIDFKINADEGVFFGISALYYAKFESVFGVELSEHDIKLSIVLSLAEIYIKNFYRYQSEIEWNDGAGILQNVETIISQIDKSRALTALT